jgi:hypothetical protein
MSEMGQSRPSRASTNPITSAVLPKAEANSGIPSPAVFAVRHLWSALNPSRIARHPLSADPVTPMEAWLSSPATMWKPGRSR